MRPIVAAFLDLAAARALPVAAYLVTGNPGSGKSTVAEELRVRGITAIDPDYDPDLSYWENRRRYTRTARRGAFRSGPRLARAPPLGVEPDEDGRGSLTT